MIRGSAALLVLASSIPFACSSPEPRAIPVDAARVRAFEDCPRPADRRDGAFRRLLDDRLARLDGDVLALADDLRKRACVAEVFLSPPVGSLRELHVTYREGLDEAWVIDVRYPEDAQGEDKLPHIGDVMKKRAPDDNPR